MKASNLLLYLFLSVFFISCGTHQNSSKKYKDINLLKDITPILKNGTVNAIVEIPSGTSDKWELNKETGKLEWEMIDNKYRVVNYLGYPGNYGFIPQTLLSKEKGGDGDPLDVLVIGPSCKRGEVLNCKIIGIMYLIDKGEQDDKLIAVSKKSPLFHIDNMEELMRNYNGVTNILQLWFSNYKGIGKMKFKGFGSKKEAMEMVQIAIDEYQKNRN